MMTPPLNQQTPKARGLKARVLTAYQYYEHAVVFVLLGLLMIVVLYATVGLLISIGVGMVQKLQTREFHVTLPLLHDVFAGFLMILIGLELMKTIVMYLDEHVIHVEVVLSVAMIAIARHAIDVDFNSVPSFSMVGIGAIILSLALGYYYFKKASFLTTYQVVSESVSPMLETPAQIAPSSQTRGSNVDSSQTEASPHR
jgi:uncharacterized membrane protein (DUF373 family)